MLRLPMGIFYVQGVKANVLFFERRAPTTEPATKAVWVYDFRTNQRFTLKTRTMKHPDLDDFVEAYKPGQLRSARVESGRFKRWTDEDLAARSGFNVDVWADVVDESITDPSQLPPPDVIAEQMIENATAGIDAFDAVAAELAALNWNGDDREEDAVEALLEHE